MGDNEIKIWCAVKTDIGDDWWKNHPGKLAAQTGHAFTGLIYDAMSDNPTIVKEYMESSQTKIVLRAKNDDLLRIVIECRSINVPFKLITDEGRTIFKGTTTTCCAFGLTSKTNLTPFLKNLKLL